MLLFATASQRPEKHCPFLSQVQQVPASDATTAGLEETTTTTVVTSEMVVTTHGDGSVDSIILGDLMEGDSVEPKLEHVLVATTQPAEAEAAEEAEVSDQLEPEPEKNPMAADGEGEEEEDKAEDEEEEGEEGEGERYRSFGPPSSHSGSI